MLCLFPPSVDPKYVLVEMLRQNTRRSVHSPTGLFHKLSVSVNAAFDPVICEGDMMPLTICYGARSNREIIVTTYCFEIPIGCGHY